MRRRGMVLTEDELRLLLAVAGIFVLGVCAWFGAVWVWERVW